MKKLFIIFAGSIFLWGCATVKFAPSIEGYAPVVISSPGKIKIYRTERPKEPYTEIGVIYSAGNSGSDKTILLMKNTASKNGGNAVIDLKETPDGSIGTVVIIEYGN
jgi:hypothetical protein